RSRRTLFCCRAATPAKPNRGCDGGFVPVFVCPIYDDLLRNDPCVQQVVNWFSGAYISALPERIWGSITARDLILRRTAMKKSYLFMGLVLGAMLPTVALCSPNVTGRWSGTLQMDGENDAKPAYSIFSQDGNKLSGSVGPSE